MHVSKSLRRNILGRIYNFIRISIIMIHVSEGWYNYHFRGFIQNPIHVVEIVSSGFIPTNIIIGCQAMHFLTGLPRSGCVVIMYHTFILCHYKP
jgi:hypothetical protein